MGGGRKNMKRATKELYLTLEDGQCIAQVVSLRGSNLIEVMNSRGEKSLALFPAKFHKSIWMQLGSFVVVDESGKEKALGSGSKVASIVSQVLLYEQVRSLQKSPEWPEIFKSTTSVDTGGSLQKSITEEEVNHEVESSDEDGLPPLEANTNRVKPPQYKSDSESDSGSEADS